MQIYEAPHHQHFFPPPKNNGNCNNISVLRSSPLLMILANLDRVERWSNNKVIEDFRSNKEETLTLTNGEKKFKTPKNSGVVWTMVIVISMFRDLLPPAAATAMCYHYWQQLLQHPHRLLKAPSNQLNWMRYRFYNKHQNPKSILQSMNIYWHLKLCISALIKQLPSD
jgi:uncharacterized protein YlzI (FlbEa/FlbD family)